MSFVVEILWQIIFDYLLAIPGAFISWALSGFKGSYFQLLKKDPDKFVFKGLVFWIVVAAVGGLIARTFS